VNFAIDDFTNGEVHSAHQMQMEPTTMTTTKQMTFAAAMKDYFGYHPGTGAPQFMAELKALSPEDKLWFRENLPTVGYAITASAA
jgi:hypothetical protein